MKTLADTIYFDIRARVDGAACDFRVLGEGTHVSFYQGSTLIAQVPRRLFNLAAHTLVSAAEEHAEEEQEKAGDPLPADAASARLKTIATLVMTYPAWLVEDDCDAERFGFDTLAIEIGHGGLGGYLKAPATKGDADGE